VSLGYTPKLQGAPLQASDQLAVSVPSMDFMPPSVAAPSKQVAVPLCHHSPCSDVLLRGQCHRPTAWCDPRAVAEGADLPAWSPLKDHAPHRHAEIEVWAQQCPKKPEQPATSQWEEIFTAEGRVLHRGHVHMALPSSKNDSAARISRRAPHLAGGTGDRDPHMDSNREPSGKERPMSRASNRASEQHAREVSANRVSTALGHRHTVRGASRRAMRGTLRLRPRSSLR